MRPPPSSSEARSGCPRVRASLVCAGQLTPPPPCPPSRALRLVHDHSRKKVAALEPKAESSSFTPAHKPLVAIDPPRMKKGKIVLSDEQKKVLEMVVDKGMNIFFTGSAGASLRPPRLPSASGPCG